MSSIRVRRGLRAGRRTRLIGGGEGDQILAWGMILVPSTERPPGETVEQERLRIFPNGDREMAKAWRARRPVLMEECGPGMRPWAFNRFDLEITDRDFHSEADYCKQLCELLQRELIEGEEALQIDRTFNITEFRPRNVKAPAYEVTPERLADALRRGYWGYRVTFVPRPAPWNRGKFESFPANIGLPGGRIEPVDNLEQLETLRRYEDTLNQVKMLELEARWHGFRKREAQAGEAWRAADAMLAELAEIDVGIFAEMFEGPPAPSAEDDEAGSRGKK